MKENPHRSRKESLKDVIKYVKTSYMYKYSIYKVVILYNVYKTTLSRHLNYNEDDNTGDVSQVSEAELKCACVGHPFILSRACAEQLAECLTVMVKWGSGLRYSREICDFEGLCNRKKEGKLELVNT